MKNLNRLPLTAIVFLTLSGPSLAQTPANTTATPPDANYPAVTFGIQSFLQYAAELSDLSGNYRNGFVLICGLVALATVCASALKLRKL